MVAPRDLLRRAGLRRTGVREAVLALLASEGRPLSHADLAGHAATAHFDPITLYRTLATFEEAGLVHRVLGVDGVARTGLHPSSPEGCPGGHAHLLCTACGAMCCLVTQSLPKVDVPDGFAVTGRQLLAWGVCARCGAAP